MESKICTKCNELKLLMKFRFRKDRGYYATVCKDCDKKYKKIYDQRVEVKEAHANRERERRKRDDVK